MPNQIKWTKWPPWVGGALMPEPPLAWEHGHSSKKSRLHSSSRLLLPRLWTEGHDRADRGRGAGPRKQVAMAS